MAKKATANKKGEKNNDEELIIPMEQAFADEEFVFEFEEEECPVIFDFDDEMYLED